MRDEIRRKIAEGSFSYADYFPDSPRAASPSKSNPLMETLLLKQLDAYARQVKNGQMSPSTHNGYAKAINGERMRRWHGLQVGEVLPGLLRDWVSEMDCTSKAIRNILTPLRSLFEDALNDELIDFNPFERIALSKLIRQTAKASDYVVTPFNAAEHEAILKACRPNERPMLQFWFETGLRPGELQALQWSHIDWDRAIARIELNQVAGGDQGAQDSTAMWSCLPRPSPRYVPSPLFLSSRANASGSIHARANHGAPMPRSARRSDNQSASVPKWSIATRIKFATPMPRLC